MKDWTERLFDMLGDKPKPPPEGATTEELVRYMERLIEAQDKEKR